MFHFNFIIKKDRRVKAWLGISLKDFRKLLQQYELAYKTYKEDYRKNERIRAVGGGRKSELFDKPSKLLFVTLFYIRVYPTFDLLEGIFCLDKANMHHWITLGMFLLEEILKEKVPLPAEKVSSFEELFKIVPDLKKHIPDATEQPINRPKYNEEHYYSGKKKRHTIKRQIVITPKKKLVSISIAVEGKRHDKQLERDTKYLCHAPPRSKRIADTAYADSTTDAIWDIETRTPMKKPPKGELTDEQKVYNKLLSSKRVKVEHVIGHLKYNRIFSDKIRYRKMSHDSIANIVGGLYNFKLGF